MVSFSLNVFWVVITKYLFVSVSLIFLWRVFIRIRFPKGRIKIPTFLLLWHQVKLEQIKSFLKYRLILRTTL